MNKTVINGLEGCGKSSDLFKELQKVTTSANPVIFAFKNYKLMREQILSWSSRHNEPAGSFAICGFNTEYEEATLSYTNKKSPWVVPVGTKFIFVTQALLQKNKIKDLSYEARILGFKRPIISHIVIDEFDFTIGIVPTLDYFINHCPNAELKEKFSKNISDYLFKNYTREDVYNFQESKTGEKFHLAYWIQDAECDITVLTSEVLATIFLEIIGFAVKDVGMKDFKNECKVHVAKDDLIGRNFFAKMNSNLAWNKLGFSTIISDCIATAFKDTNSLEVSVVSHMGARGSNALIGQDILTVLSYIPKSKIEEIKDCLNYFIKDKNKDGFEYPFFGYLETEALFYRDRLCQSIGRVLGYRGSKETHLLVHSEIYKSLDSLMVHDLAIREKQLDLITSCDGLKFRFNRLILNRLSRGVDLFPYTTVEWYFRFEGMEEIWQKIGEANERGSKDTQDRRKNRITHKAAATASNLKYYFELCEGSELPYPVIQEVILRNDIRSVIGLGLLQPMKVMKYFGIKMKQTFKGKFLVGIKLTDSESERHLQAAK